MQPTTTSPWGFYGDFDSQTRTLFQTVKPFTMTSPERVWALRQSVRYVVRNEIEGDLVECGVWRGGSVMAMLSTLQELGVSDRRVWAFDTFSGMSAPTEFDVNLKGEPAADLLREAESGSLVRAACTLSEVEENLTRTGYPLDRVKLVKGRVEETLPAQVPERISLLRLDTDFYESTLHELRHLYPRLTRGGVLILDDYGHWAGARKAVDEYIEEHRLKLLLSRIDYTARMCVKLD